MAISTDAIPTAFRPGYERARAIDPIRAEVYMRNTMVVDPIADAAVKSLVHLNRRESHRLIEAGMNRDEKALKAAPRELQDFFEALKSSAYFEFQRDVAMEGSRAFFSTPDIFIAAIVAKGLVENISTLMGRSFVETGYTTFSGVQRLRTSMKQVLECMLPGGLEEYGDGWKLSVRARLMHARARHTISQLPEAWDVEEFGEPVSAAHLGFATASFSVGVLSALKQLGVNLSAEEREGYVHNWRYIGWIIGVPEEILLKDEADGLALLKIARICEPPPNVDSVMMAHAIITSVGIGAVGREDKKKLEEFTMYVYKVTRAILGNGLSDQLELPKSRVPGPLVLAGVRWKLRIDQMFGRSPSRSDSFIGLLEATADAVHDYGLREAENA